MFREDRLSMFEWFLEDIKKEYDAAGIAVAFVDGQGACLCEKYLGYRDEEQQLELNSDTIFGLASVTKSFTCLAIMQLAQNGVISLEDPVSRYIPEFTNKNQATVRLWHLMCHSGGFYPLPRILVDTVAQELGLDEEKAGDLAYNEALAVRGCKLVAQRLDSQTRANGLLGKPGEYLSYCNDGYGLLSEIIRRCGGEASYAQYIKKHILLPLGMTRSGCDFLLPKTDQNACLLYKKTDGKRISSRDYRDNAFVLNGGGAMKSTLKDMMSYVTMYLNGGKTINGVPIIDAYSLREMVKPRQFYRGSSWYGYGLSTKMLEDFRMVEHGGSLPGVSSNIAWSYELGAGVVILCNTSEVPVAKLSDAAMLLLSGRDPLPKRDLHISCGWDQKTLAAALGTYRSGEGAVLEIGKNPTGTPTLLLNGNPKKIIPINKVDAVIRDKMTDNSLRLHFDHLGRVFAVRFGGRMIPRA